MEENKRNKIIAFLKKLGYDDKVLIDEYQAYRYTEKDNFLNFYSLKICSWHFYIFI